MGKRTVDLVLILCLVVGVFVSQSTADNSTQCFDNCVRDCLRRSSHRRDGAGVCYSKCSNFCHMNTKPCVLFWCWK